MSNPWTALDAATQNKNLYLDHTIIGDVDTASSNYEKTLNQLIIDRVDDTSGYFGTGANPLAVLLQNAFNARGTELVTYLNAQMSQTQDFVKTAKDAAAAQLAAEHD